MKILLISGSLPPMRCGVGDYTSSLARALQDTSEAQIAVLTGKGEISTASGIEIIQVPDWGLGSAVHVLRAIANWNPDIVHMQFPTQGYAVSLLPWLLPILIRAAGFPVVQTWHEFLPMRRHRHSFMPCIASGTVVVVRRNYLESVGPWYRWLLRKTRIVFVPNASTVPESRLAQDERSKLNEDLRAGQARLVTYFGFANPNKSVELLFQIANPDRDRILLICDLDNKNPYQRRILDASNAPPWSGKVTITGFLPSDRVADFLAASDAVVLPFLGGGGDWNSSIHAVSDQGVFLATTSLSREGYDPEGNVFYSRPADVESMAHALDTYMGRKVIPPPDRRQTWEKIALTHLQLYRDVLPKKTRETI